jgi:hypothetical protein
LLSHRELTGMSRTLQVLCRRDPSKDRQDDRIAYEGYQFYWPDGRPVAVGLDAFCKHGQRLLGLGKHLAGTNEKLIEMICVPIKNREENMTRLDGHRVRRFYLERNGLHGRLHFMDGTPTAIVLEVGRDESPVLHWIGLTGMRDGDRQWFDLAARPVEVATVPLPSKRAPFRSQKYRRGTVA